MENEVEIAKNLLVMDSHLLGMKCVSKSCVKVPKRCAEIAVKSFKF